MTGDLPRRPVPIPADQAQYLVATAARAPSVHNTQPWRFHVGSYEIELSADPARKLRVDPAGREMLISCGAALFGLRLAVRSLGFVPVVQLLPDPAQLRLLARVSLGAAEPMPAAERQLLAALSHRHTHRGPWLDAPLPSGLAAALQNEARAEHAQLVMLTSALAYQKLADIVAAVAPRQDLDPVAQEEMARWTRESADRRADGVPAQAFPVHPDRGPGRLPQRDFDLGRGLGRLPGGGPPPAASAILLTTGDTRADWLRAGQALHRLLARAASRWVFASLHTQPLEAGSIRALIRERLALPGVPQVLLQLGVARTSQATARRPAAELIDP